MLGANVVEPEIYHTEDEHDEVMGESEPDYKQEIKASVDAEYDEFKETLYTCEKSLRRCTTANKARFRTA